MTSEKKRKSIARGVKKWRSEELEKLKLYMRKYWEQGETDKEEAEARKSWNIENVDANANANAKKKNTGGKETACLASTTQDFDKNFI